MQTHSTPFPHSQQAVTDWNGSTGRVPRVQSRNTLLGTLHHILTREKAIQKKPEETCTQNVSFSHLNFMRLISRNCLSSFLLPLEISDSPSPPRPRGRARLSAPAGDGKRSPIPPVFPTARVCFRSSIAGSLHGSVSRRGRRQRRCAGSGWLVFRSQHEVGGALKESCFFHRIP